MRIKTITLVFFIIGAFVANVPAIAMQYSANDSATTTGQLAIDRANSLPEQLSSAEISKQSMKNWVNEEALYWREKNKNDYISNLFREKAATETSANNSLKLTYDYYGNDPVINIDLDKLFYQPGDTVNFIVQVSRNLVAEANYDLEIKIFNQNDNIFYQYGGYYYQYQDSTPFKSLSVTTNGQGLYQGSFIATTSGQYSIFVTSSDQYSNYYYGPSAFRSVTVSNLALYSRIPYYFIPSQPITGYSIVLDGNTFTPMENASVNVTYYSFDWEQEVPVLEKTWSGTTDTTGKVMYSISTDFSSDWWGYLAITAEKDGVSTSSRRSIWSSYYYQQQDAYEFVPTLDKPIYQPKETLHGRVLVWENQFLNATKTPAQFSQVSIQLLSPSSTLLMQLERVTDENGIISFDIPFDESVETGTYTLIFKKGEFQQSISIPVEFYEKPAYRVTINLDKEYVPNGDTATGEVSVQYYFGKPVTNAKIELSLLDPGDKVLQSLTGTSNAKGVFSFSVPINVDEGVSQVRIQAKVTDPVGREVSATTTIVTVSNIYMWSWVYPWTPQINDEIYVSYYVYQGYYGFYDYGYYTPPKAFENAKVRILVRGINTDSLLGIVTKNITVRDLISDTNSYGFGRASFKLDQLTVLNFDYFQVLTILEIDDGRTASSQTRFDYAKLHTEFNFDKSVYSSGDYVDVTIAVKDLVGDPGNARVRINVFDADYDTLYRGSLEIQGSSKVILKLTDFAPEGQYKIYSSLVYSITNELGSTQEKYVYGGNNYFTVGTSNQFELSLDEKDYSAGDLITITGSLTSSNVSLSSPLYYEISKRGVLASGTLVLSGTSFEIQLNNTEYLTPKITLLFTAFTSNGVIIEQYIEVKIKQKLSLEITSDKSVYEPGDPFSVSIKIKNSNNVSVSGVAVISFVDSSIYGVKEDPEWEADHFTLDEYWSSMATVTNWRGFQSTWYYYWYDFGDVGMIRAPMVVFATAEAGFDAGSAVKQNSAGAPPSIDTSQITIRDNLPESMNWMPRVLIPATGYFFNSTLPDNIGEWTVRVTATKGQTGVLSKYTFNTQLPFFVEMEKPPTAMQDDIVTIKGIFYNYLDDTVKANVSITVDEAVILNRESQSLTIPEGYLTSVKWTVYVPQSGRLNITIYSQTLLSGVIHSDAIRKQLIVLSNGVEEKFISSGVINDQGVSFNLTSYNESVFSRQFLVISRGLEDVVLDSWERLVGYPYGCLEQTMSKLIPDVLIKDYLKAKGELTDSLQDKLDNMVTSGVSRIYSMQTYDGGFSWWGDDQTSNAYMTAYAIYGLTKVKNSGYPVSDFVLNQAISYLQGQQNSNGNWVTNYWHMDNFAFTAFVLRALLDMNVTAYPGLSQTIASGLSYIKNNWVSNSTTASVYTAGLILLGTYNTSFWDTSFSSTLLDYISSNKKSNQNGIYWSVDPKVDYYWKPLGGSVETTAVIMQALTNINYGAYNSLVSSSLNWLLHEQKPWGWYNTKGTAEAISTIMNLLDYSGNNTVGSVNLSVNGSPVKTFILGDSQEISPFDLSSVLTTGLNQISLVGTSGSKFSYYLESIQNLRTTPKIVFNDKLKANPNTIVSIPITISPVSNNVLIKDLKVTLLKNNWANTSSLTLEDPLLTGTKKFSFNLQTTGELGINIIKGIQLEYYLVSKDGTRTSPGVISQIFGPISVEVTTEQLPSQNLLNNEDNDKPATKLNIVNIQRSAIVNDGLQLEKTFSTYSTVSLGEFVTVSLDLTSNQDQNNEFLFIVDPIPTGFVVDETSLQTLIDISSYSVSSTNVVFYLNSIASSKHVSISYRLQASENILASIAPAATVASMYEDEVSYSSASYTLGDFLVRKNFSGEVVRDISLPDLLKYEYHTVSNDALSFEVNAKDDEGISLVKVFYKDQAWSSQDLAQQSTNNWHGVITDLGSRKIAVYIEIHDIAGNIYISDELLVTLVVAVILPVLLFAVLLATGTIGGTGYIFMKRRLWKGD